MTNVQLTPCDRQPTMSATRAALLAVCVERYSVALAEVRDAERALVEFGGETLADIQLEGYAA